MSGRTRPGHFACPHCGFCDTAVVDTRGAIDRSEVIRRRQCGNCKSKFSTAERWVSARDLTTKQMKAVIRALDWASGALAAGLPPEFETAAPILPKGEG